MKQLTFCLVFLLSMSSLAQAIQEISIGVTTNQPPYSFHDEGGFVADIVTELNKIQDLYLFMVLFMPPERNRVYINTGKVDMLGLVNINWGYDKKSMKSSMDLLKVQDKYFSLKLNARDQSYFDNIGKESTIVVNGFNYKFLSFEKDQNILKKRYNTTTVKDEPTIIAMILANRGKIGVSSTTSLNYYKKNNPDSSEKLLISEKSDSDYFIHFIVRNDSKIDVKELNGYLEQLLSSGKMKEILSKYGL